MGKFKSLLWTTNGGDGVPYTQGDLTFWQRMLWTTDPSTQGITAEFLDELEVTNPIGLQLHVATGGCLVYGFVGWLPATAIHDLVLPVVGETGWRMVVRIDWSTQLMQTYLLQNTDGDAAIPAMTQTAGTRWEIPLAYGTITLLGTITVTDDRYFISPSSGIGTDAIADESIIPQYILNRTRRFWCAAVDAYDSSGEPLWNTGTGRGWQFQDAITTEGYGAFNVPTDFVSDMKVRAVIIGDLGGGNYYYSNMAVYGADAESYNIHTAEFAIAAIANPGNGIKDEAAQIALDDAQVGDSVSLKFRREGGAGSDTATGQLVFPGWIVEYTADS